MRKLMLLAVACGGLWLLAVEPARSQTYKSGDATRPGMPRQYYATFSNPPVSPYVNLGVTSSGISNYQTLVRPLIEERKAIAQQSAAIDQLNQRISPTANRRGNDERDARPRPSVRFMDYSRHFGTTWRNAPPER